MSMSSSRLCLVRHGETDWNADRRIQGQIDSPLNATGKAQAAAVAGALAGTCFAAIYSSDLARARATAETIAARHRMPIQLCRELRERHYGVFQGLSYPEAEARYPDRYARFHHRDIDEDFEDGESLRSFSTRVSTTLQSIAQKHFGAQVFVATHGGVLDIAYRLATRRPLHTARDFTISNATVSWIAWTKVGWQLLSWNEDPAAKMGLDELPG
jgi:probable phosphoglycerate mutase